MLKAPPAIIPLIWFKKNWGLVFKDLISNPDLKDFFSFG
jgi:hypothetical protein